MRQKSSQDKNFKSERDKLCVGQIRLIDFKNKSGNIRALSLSSL